MRITRKEKILLALLLGAAISTAAHAEGERIENPTGETIEITDETFSGLSGTDGGAVENEGTVTGITGSSFKENAADLYGGAIYNEGTIGDISAGFSENKASNNGGAIYNAGEIETISGEFTSNSSEDYGGAIYNDSKGEILNIEAEFTSNTAERGGAIANSGTIWSISGSTFTTNAVDFTGGGAISNRGDIIEISGTTFSGNTATDSQGGAINNSGTIGAIADSKFEGNEVNIETADFVAGGGAIHNSGSIEEISGTSMFSENVVTVTDGVAAGGAIFNAGAIGEVTADFSGNIVTGGTSSYGGAIYNSGSIDSVEGIFSSNTASYGGGIYNDAGGAIESITGSTFANNEASVEGGAIYNGGSIGEISADFTENTADLYGGAIANAGEIETITGSFTTNTGDGGGAIYNEGTISEISGSQFTGNSATVLSGHGGAIYNYSGGEILSIESSEFASNTAEDSGGAIYNEGIIWNISESEFSGNEANDSEGGAIYNISNIVQISDATFSGNWATDGQGGAIYNRWSGTIGIIEGSEFAGNYVYIETADSAAGGGAIHNRGTIEEISGTSFSGNIAAVGGYAAGGAIYNAGTINELAADFDGNYTNNEDTTYGGAIYNVGTIGSVEGNFTNNTAYGTSGYGGAIYNGAGGTVESITGSTFENNVASMEGGAIYNDGSIGEISADFTGNSATLYGGAIYNASEIESISGSFTSNTSDYGGAIYNTSEIGTISGDFTSNSSTNYGGAIYNDSDADILSIEDAEFASNEAERGGAIFNAGTIWSISGTEFAENEANYINGGAIYNGGDIVQISGTTFSGNKATDCFGGAIFNSSNGTIGAIAEGEFVGNYVEADEAAGGAIYNTGTIDSIGGDFTGNYAEGDSTAAGGAIYNEGTIDTITADFTGNYAEGGSTASGGAIYNEGEIGSIEGDFTGNYATGMVASGGAIYATGGATIGEITGDFTGNYAEGGLMASGGAIYIEDGEIGSIGGDFTGNYATGMLAFGGAIYTKDETVIGEITGDFTGNFAGGYDSYGDAVSSAAQGGAMYIEDTTIDSIEGDFTGNYAVATGSALGGAIYVYDYGEIATITGNFTDNYVELSGDEEGIAAGGAMYLGNEMAEDAVQIVGNFENNHAVSYSTDSYSHAAGGAIASLGWMDIKGDFTGNYVEAVSGLAYGGAIYDVYGGVEITGDVIGNHASSEYGNAYGGAATAQAIAIEGDIIGNWVEAKNGVALGGAICPAQEMLGPEEMIATIQGNYAIGGELAMGGAIYGQSTMAVAGNFTDNYVMAVGEDGDAYGGAVAALSADDDEQQVLLAGDFENNRAISESGDAYGGAVVIYHFGGKYGALTADIEGDFTENYAVAENGTAMGGGVYNSDTTEITGDFTGNYVQGLEAYGGAIYNALPEQSEDEDDDEYDAVLLFNGDLTGNHAEAKSTDESDSGNAYGGAVYNESNMAIYAGMELTDNYATSEAGEAKGGAFYNNVLTLTYVDDDEGYEGYLVVGDVTGNYVEGATGAYGGAIYNEDADTTVVVEGDITDNHATTETGEAFGGAIYSETAVIVEADSITGNYAKATDGAAIGGAIFVGFPDEESEGSEGSITVSGEISDNHVAGANDSVQGGAIFSGGLVTISAGSLTDNSAESGSGDVAGGAIYISDDGAGSTITVSGDVSGNYVTTAGGEDGAFAQGGAIYAVSALSSEDDDDDDDVDPYSVTTYSAETGITEITVSGNVTENYASGVDGAQGGAIYIEGDGIVTIEGDVTGNYVEAEDEAQGGAIYSEGGTITLSGNIKDNYAEGATAQGGAIYTYGNVEIIADGTDIVISGNYANDDDNAIYIAQGEESESIGSVNFSLSDGASIFLYDNINGDEDYGVDITGDGLDTTFFLLNDLYNADLSIGNTTLDTVDGVAHVYNVNSFSVTDDFDMVVDVDLAEKEMDRFVTTEGAEGEHSGTLNVAAVNIVSDAEGDSTKILFAEEGLKDNVTSSVDTAYTPVYKYSFNYDNTGDAGYFVIDKTGFNPAVMASTVSQMGLYNTMNLMYGYTFEHSDYFMKLPAEVRLAVSEGAKAKKAPKENDPTKAAYYNQNEMTERGAWVKTFASNENVSYRGGLESRDKYYGALVGFDSNLREHGNGWASVLTGYVGTMGIRQTYDGGHTKQHGGVIGVTESFYKKNFYTAWTAAAGTAKAESHTMYGYEKNRNDTWGIAAKFGWNFELAGGKFALLPTFTASYTYINPEDYSNGADVKIDGSGVRAVQLNPNLKFIMNMKNGLQPYLTVGEVWTVGQSSSMHANGEKLDELELRPYTEYGVGVQKRWANQSDAYLQLMGHSHGRDGFLVNAGIRWNF